MLWTKVAKQMRLTRSMTEDADDDDAVLEEIGDGNEEEG